MLHIFPALALASDAQIETHSEILAEAGTEGILCEKDCHARLVPAGVAKIIMMLLTIEAVENRQLSLDEMGTAS